MCTHVHAQEHFNPAIRSILPVPADLPAMYVSHDEQLVWPSRQEALTIRHPRGSRHSITVEAASTKHHSSSKHRKLRSKAG